MNKNFTKYFHFDFLVFVVSLAFVELKSIFRPNILKDVQWYDYYRSQVRRYTMS